MDWINIAAYVAVAILSALALFQLALIVGAPLGEYAWGGQQKKLSPKLRAGSVLSVVLYALFAYVALVKAELITTPLYSITIDILTWMFFAYFIIGIAMNAISRSVKEWSVMTPVAVVLALCFLVLALS